MKDPLCLICGKPTIGTRIWGKIGGPFHQGCIRPIAEGDLAYRLDAIERKLDEVIRECGKPVSLRAGDIGPSGVTWGTGTDFRKQNT